MDKRKILLACIILFALFICPSVRADESDLFTTVSPDALIVLDLSGSMNWTPYGETMYTVDGGSCSSSTGLFYGEIGTGHAN